MTHSLLNIAEVRNLAVEHKPLPGEYYDNDDAVNVYKQVLMDESKLHLIYTGEAPEEINNLLAEVDRLYFEKHGPRLQAEAQHKKDVAAHQQRRREREERERRKQEKKEEIYQRTVSGVSKVLARHRTKLIYDEASPRPETVCNCVGISCMDDTCPIWWGFVLEDVPRLQRAFKLLEHTEDILRGDEPGQTWKSVPMVGDISNLVMNGEGNPCWAVEVEPIEV